MIELGFEQGAGPSGSDHAKIIGINGRHDQEGHLVRSWIAQPEAIVHIYQAYTQRESVQ